jgi:hypothetical protein
MKRPVEAWVDAERNILRTHYSGVVTPASMKEAEAGVVALTLSMKPGYTTLVDFSGLESMDIDCAPYLARMMELNRKQGAGKVVRVIPDPSKDIGVNILSIVHYRGKVQIATFDVLAEAERELGLTKA